MRLRGAVVGCVLMVAPSVRAQEIQLSGPLANAPAGPTFRPTRAWAFGGHLVAGASRGGGAIVRARTDGRLAFDLVADFVRDDGETIFPLTARLVGYQRLTREHDFFLAVGPTLRFLRGEEHHGTGAEAALGLEGVVGWWTMRAETAAFVTDDRGVRTQGVFFRLGLLNVFGRAVYRD